MDPPMSYAVGGQLESLKIYRGIVPVSVAQESIGGAIDVKSIPVPFTHLTLPTILPGLLLVIHFGLTLLESS